MNLNVYVSNRIQKPQLSILCSYENAMPFPETAWRRHGAPSIGLCFAEKIMSDFAKQHFFSHHLMICWILFLTKIRQKKFTCNNILIVDSEIQLLFLRNDVTEWHRDLTLDTMQLGRQLTLQLLDLDSREPFEVWARLSERQRGSSISVVGKTKPT